MEILRDLFPELSDEERREIEEEKEAKFRAFAGDLEPKPGLRDLLSWMDNKEMKRALVTSAPSEKRGLHAALSRFGGQVSRDGAGRATGARQTQPTTL